MKNSVFWDVTSCASCKNLESPYVAMSSLPIEESYVRFEVFTAVTMKNAVFRNVTPCGCCFLTRVIQRNIPEDAILQISFVLSNY
jgi:hypothetical protein